MVLLFENGFSAWGQFLQSFCRSTRAFTSSKATSDMTNALVLLQKLFQKLSPCQKTTFQPRTFQPKKAWLNCLWLKSLMFQQSGVGSLGLKSPNLKCSATIFLVIENYTSFSSAIILCLLGTVIIPLFLGTLRMVFTDSKEFIGVKRSKKRVFLYLWKLVLFLLSPLIHPMLMMKEKRAFTKVKNFLKSQTLQEHEKFSQLVTKWNQWQIQ